MSEPRRRNIMYGRAAVADGFQNVTEGKTYEQAGEYPTGSGADVSRRETLVRRRSTHDRGAPGDPYRPVRRAPRRPRGNDAHARLRFRARRRVPPLRGHPGVSRSGPPDRLLRRRAAVGTAVQHRDGGASPRLSPPTAGRGAAVRDDGGLRRLRQSLHRGDEGPGAVPPL